MRGISIAAAALVAALNTPAHAGFGFVDGNELHDLCRDEDGICVGYVTGVFDALAALEMRRCDVPENVTVRQLRDVVRDYVRDNPADRHVFAPWLVMASIGSAWPCDE